MLRSKVRYVVFSLVGINVTGCVGGGAPSDPYDLGARQPDVVGSGGAGDVGEPLVAAARDSHFPLTDGATWTYHHTNLIDDPWDETDTVVATTYDGKDAFIFSDEEDAEGEQTHSTLIVDGTGVYRAYKEIEVADTVVTTTTYDPPFLRYDEAWQRAGDTVTLNDDWVQRCIVASSASNCAAGAEKPGSTTHTYTVLDVAARVTVPAGTFTTVKIQRDNVSDVETKIFWFAAGVGKVREENPVTQAVTELVTYEIP